MGKKEKERDCILLNKMYVGTYLSSKNNNIGHEVINLIQTDEGENYISVMPYSVIGNDKIGRVQTVLLVRAYGIKLLEILAKADVEDIGTDKKSFKYIYQKNYIEGNKNIGKKPIKYGGQYLNEIYAKNNNVGNGQGSLITFKVKEDGLKKVKDGEKLFITTSNDYVKKFHDEKKKYRVFLIEEKDGFPPRNKPIYYSKNSDGYNNLKDIIDDKNLWEDKNTTPKITEKYINELLKNEKHSMVDILDKKDAENTYSNFFYHIFDSNHELFKEFANDVLEIKDMSADFTIAREEGTKATGRIDLLMYDDNNVIVIENKIKSDINGKQFDDKGNLITTQLDKYYEYVNLMAYIKGKDKEEIEEEEKQKEYKEKFKGKEKYYYIFAPKYSRIAQKEEKIELEKYIKDDKNAYYTVITYDRLYNFFSCQERKDRNSFIPYYEEFLYALEKHKNDTDNHFESEILKRFVKVIRTMNEEKNLSKTD